MKKYFTIATLAAAALTVAACQKTEQDAPAQGVTVEAPADEAAAVEAAAEATEAPADEAAAEATEAAK
jgi:ABC-type metal ion transport system substrate-binding protein